MRWLKKREAAAYAHLALRYGGTTIGYIEALAELSRSFAMSTKTSRNVLRRLINTGYLVKLNARSLLVRRPEDVLSELASEYALSRRKRAKTHKEV